MTLNSSTSGLIICMVVNSKETKGYLQDSRSEGFPSAFRLARSPNVHYTRHSTNKLTREAGNDTYGLQLTMIGYDTRLECISKSASTLGSVIMLLVHCFSVVPVGSKVHNIVFGDFRSHPFQQIGASRLSFLDVDLISANDGPDLGSLLVMTK